MTYKRNMNINLRLVGFVMLCLHWHSMNAAIKLPSFISDGVVLQRNTYIPIWGWADVGEQVIVVFNGKSYSAITGPDKKWNIKLDPNKAGGPFEMSLKGSNSITLKNILVGDVWLCSGQSNMEYELYKSADIYKKEIQESSNDKIRHFAVKRKIAFNSTDDVGSEKGWESANPSSVLNWTAVGYFFAKNLFDQYHVPIGLINCSYGGTPAEAWINENDLHQFPAYYENAMRFKDDAIVKKMTERDKKFSDDWYAIINSADSGTKQKWFSPDYDASDWKTMKVPNYWQDQGLEGVDDGAIVWFKKEIFINKSSLGKNATLFVGNISMRDNTYFNGEKVGYTTSKYPLRKYAIDSKLLKEGKNVITIRILNENGKGGFIKDKPYKLELSDSTVDISGAWQYKLSATSKALLRGDMTRFQDQGSSMYHGMLAPLVGFGIKGVIWYQGESNVSKAASYHALFSTLINSWRKEWNQGDFPFLFVQLANINLPKAEPSQSKLAELQEAQQQTLSLPNTGMAVANDVGEWNDVHPKNKMDVGNRLALAARKLAYHEKKIVYSGPTYESMKVKGNKIELLFSNVGSGLVTKDGGELKHFAISDSSGKMVWAKASIKGNKIVVWSENIQKPTSVRYAWADNPVGANLCNKEGLPASCFRTDKINK